MNPVILPYVGNPGLTRQAIEDVLSQTIPDVRLLLIGNGGEPVLPAYYASGNLVHWHTPTPFPSLSTLWNLALATCWTGGAEHALVINNDVRLHRQTYETLLYVQGVTDAWLVTGVGVTAEQFDPAFDPMTFCTCPVQDHSWYHCAARWPKGGPDFSCFLITKEGHERYPFDENFRPAYCEDLDLHRRYLLDGNGSKIFGVNLPFLHYRSSTLQGMTPEQRAATEAAIDTGSRAYYRRKWGGDCNQERYSRPFDPTSEQDGVTTPERQFGRI